MHPGESRENGRPRTIHISGPPVPDAPEPGPDFLRGVRGNVMVLSKTLARTQSPERQEGLLARIDGALPHCPARAA